MSIFDFFTANKYILSKQTNGQYQYICNIFSLLLSSYAKNGLTTNNNDQVKKKWYSSTKFYVSLQKNFFNKDCELTVYKVRNFLNQKRNAMHQMFNNFLF
jgi:hypothetical protein